MTTKICENCGAENDEKAFYCDQCGVQFQESNIEVLPGDVFEPEETGSPSLSFNTSILGDFTLDEPKPKRRMIHKDRTLKKKRPTD